MDNQNPTPNPTPPTENISPQNPTVEASPPTPKSFLSTKIILLIVMFFILIVGSGTYLALNSKPKPAPIVSKEIPTSTPTSTTDPTANWKVFNNKYFGFAHKYPDGWINDNGDQGPNQPVRENSTERYFHPSDAKYPKGITYIIYPKNALRGGFEVSKEKVMTWSFKNKKVEEITIDGYQGIKVSGLLDGVQSEAAVLQNKDYVFEISSHDGFVDTLDLMISTFKFTETSPTPTCRPRPACLDATPRCLMPETSDMCPPTITPSP